VTDQILGDAAQFKALSHPLRHRLLITLRQRPATLAQLAAALGAPKGTVGYHTKVLLDAGLIRVAHARQVRGGTERYLEPCSPSLRFAPDAPVGGEFLVRAALDEMKPPSPGTPDRTFLRHLRLTTAQATALADRLEEIARNADPPAPGDTQYGLLLSIYSADVPTLGPDDPV
jgi:DNA-binding transcriptional ArsR family regulator